MDIPKNKINTYQLDYKALIRSVAQSDQGKSSTESHVLNLSNISNHNNRNVRNWGKSDQPHT